MKHLIFGVIYSVLVAVIEFFLAMQLAYFASFHNDLAAYMHAPHICWDPNILYWQGNKLFFNKIMIIIGISVACTLLSSLFRSSRIDRERKARERNMTTEERKYFSHIATHAEAKKGLVRLHFDYKGMLDHMYFYKESCYKDLKWWIGIISFVVQMICLFFNDSTWHSVDHSTILTRLPSAGSGWYCKRLALDRSNLYWYCNSLQHKIYAAKLLARSEGI